MSVARVESLPTARALAVLAERWALEDGAAMEAGFVDSLADDFLASSAAVGWVAFAGGEPAGFVSAQQITPIRRPGHTSWRWLNLDGFYVLPGLRGHGIGGRLLEELGAWASRERFKRAQVCADPAARNCYERAGFRPRANELAWTLPEPPRGRA